MRKLMLALPALVLVAGLVAVVEPEWQVTPRAAKSRPAAPGQVAAVAVEAAPARMDVFHDDLRAVGSLMSEESVQIASEIAGRIESFGFSEGQPVAAGAELIKLDDALARAELTDAQARFGLASANRDRARALSKTGHVTGRAHDEADANYQIAQAALELAHVRLSKHVIKAPFGGIVGLRNASVGAYVSIGTPIVNLEKIDVLKIDFKLPEAALTQVGTGQSVAVEVDALPGRTFAAEVYAISPMVDINGRALHVRARMANPDLVLRPGLFARILVKGRETRRLVLVPESAIVPRGGETFVYQIQGGKAVETRVTLGKRDGGSVQVLSGLEPDTMVVVAGQLKLRNGVAVEIVQSQSRSGLEKS
ncbi:MAG: efflux RND transporter periplasmic adaptor subunit [Hyphomicrobiaceae bacterium]|nr:efflux RND transporter periplasmic adaptor subunit [Hyphomicrobiaceae bacterium]